MKVLVFGASGMIGSAMVRVLSEAKEWQVFGTLRSETAKRFFVPAIASRLLTNIDVDSQDALVRVFAHVKPDVVVNCIGLTKHHQEASDPLLAIPVNALLPHRMAALCAVIGARFVHVSTDCIFAGTKGGYFENDAADASDLYGKSKFLGEVNCPHTITLRTSTIGHELETTHGLLEWFLSQESTCKGFTKAVFSGLPNTVFAQIVRDIVIPRADLSGLFHVGAAPIGKFDLLRLIADVYGKSIDVIRDDGLVIDRSLDSTRFYKATSYDAPSWPALVQSMYMSRQREMNDVQR
jgi:dTDP-4-dehydrorhamnose reductase